MYWSPVWASFGCFIVLFSIFFHSSLDKFPCSFSFKSTNSLLALISVYLSANCFFSSNSANAKKFSVSVFVFLAINWYFPSVRLSASFATPTVSVIFVPFSFTSFTICSCSSLIGIFFDTVLRFSSSAFVMLSLTSI